MSDNCSFVSENIKHIRRRMEAAAVRAGRNIEDIKLVAASKTKDTYLIREAAAAGITAVGENKVQELLAKYEEGAYQGLELHFIGHLQKNKVNKLIGKTVLIHSVDSIPLMETIGKCANSFGIIQDILIEINIAGEVNKSGVSPEGVRELLSFAANCPDIHVKGIMSIPPAAASDFDTRRFFKEMHKLFVDIRGEKRHNVSMEYLSMGMSGDFETAIEEGANIIRVGSAVFGSR